MRKPIDRDEMNSLIETLVEHFGNQTKTAHALGMDQSTVSGWLNNKHRMSPITAIKAEEATEGIFTKEQLCPHVFSTRKT